MQVVNGSNGIVVAVGENLAGIKIHFKNAWKSLPCTNKDI